MDERQTRSPYFDNAIRFLKQFADGVKLADNDKIFENDERIVYPNIVVLDNPYPVIQCTKRLFSKQNKIEVSYGIFVLLGILGKFEETIKEIFMYGHSNEGLWERKKDTLKRCVNDALNYLEQSYHVDPQAAPKMPKMELHRDIFYEALRFIVGHELSHYLDPYFNYDYRELQKSVIRKICFGTFNGLERTRNKKHVDEFVNNLSDNDEERSRFYDNMVEEVLADYEGYLYLWNLPSDPYKILKHNLGVSIAFLALKLMEYFENALKKGSQEVFSVSVKWREIFLIATLYDRHYRKYDSIMEYINCEWRVYQILDDLFDQTMSEIESENGLNREKESSDILNENLTYEISYCRKRIEKLKMVSPSEVEDIFSEINKIFDDNSMNESFYKAFPAEELAIALCKIGYVFYQNGIYDAAYLWWFRAVTYFDVSDNPKGLLEADCYYYLGKICCDKGYYENAASWYGQALSIRQNHVNLSPQDNALLNLEHAGALIECGKYDLAEKSLQEMLSYTEDKYTLKEIYRKMGIICDKLYNNEKALDWFSKGLAVAEVICGTNNLELSTFYNSIGIIYYNMGNYDESYKYLMRAYEIKKSQLDPNNISLSNTIYSLGRLETKRECYGKAIEWLEKALEIRLRSLGENHPRVADAYQSIGIAYYLNKDNEKALMYHKRAYAILKDTLGCEHENTAKAERNIELCWKALNEEDFMNTQ